MSPRLKLKVWWQNKDREDRSDFYLLAVLLTTVLVLVITGTIFFLTGNITVLIGGAAAVLILVMAMTLLS